jgi:RNase H-fold protein (predicted Holliday junction resolvase)
MSFDINRYSKEDIYTLLLIPIAVMMERIMLSVSKEMYDALDRERKARKLETVPEAARAVLGEYFKQKEA